jgi:ABC-type transporter Mla subunit MlaD
MNGGSLRLNDEVLADLDRSMTMIRDVLSNAGGAARNDAKAAGDERLAEQLVEFADDWRKTRNHMLQEIDKFQSMVATTVESFAQTDQQLAAALVRPDPRGTIASTRG